MVDGVRSVQKKFKEVSKEDAIGHKGVWTVGGSRDYFRFIENSLYFGIEVSNCCGCGILWTKK